MSGTPRPTEPEIRQQRIIAQGGAGECSTIAGRRLNSDAPGKAHVGRKTFRQADAVVVDAVVADPFKVVTGGVVEQHDAAMGAVGAQHRVEECPHRLLFGDGFPITPARCLKRRERGGGGASGYRLAPVDCAFMLDLLNEYDHGCADQNDQDEADRLAD